MTHADPRIAPPPHPSRRRFIAQAGAAGAVLLAPRAARAQTVDLGLPGGPSLRPLTRAFPQKGELILQRNRPALLETPMAVFDADVFTPNDRFYVRWHWAGIPTAIDAAAFRLTVRGAVAKPLSLSLAELLRMPRVELAAVNQCSGNSRGLFEPRVPGAQWGHGAMGNARWQGVRLRDVLDRAGVRAGAIAIRFNGLDQAVMPGAPDFAKSLALDHARDGEVMLAFAMNGAALPLLNGFPLRLVVPGWYSTYWVKMLSDIEVLAAPDTNYWTAKAYRIPATPRATVPPGATGFPTEPISRMVPRAWITNVADGATLPRRPLPPVRGIALGGDVGVAAVALSADGGRSWSPATLGCDEGRYSFRRFEAALPALPAGPVTLIARCTNAAGVTQPLTPNWNPSGYMRDCVEPVRVTIA